ncbi:hypothetical protein KQX54_002836, partial [Cotesia glomerata]
SRLDGEAPDPSIRDRNGNLSWKSKDKNLKYPSIYVAANIYNTYKLNPDTEDAL